jgi:glycosyltransferase involved in cell wall biosynthesis
MNISAKLQIILITYNRQKHVEKTFEQIFCDKSPVKNYDFIVLDNNSTDSTAEFIYEMQKKYANIKYQKNKYNLGIAGNIAKAMELASKEYVWIICDDDIYDWSNWAEVEQAINNNEKLICVARYAIKDSKKTDVASQLLQMTFIPAIIYNTSLFNDSTMRNSFDNIFTLFPHLFPVIHFINQNQKIYVLNKSIVDNGMNEKTDVSYIRGIKSEFLCQRTRTMSWIVGYANACSMIKNINLKHEAIKQAINYIHGDFKHFLKDMIYLYSDEKNCMQIVDVYSQLNMKDKLRFVVYFVSRSFFGTKAEEEQFIIKFFGIKIRLKKYYENDYTVINFFGIKIKKHRKTGKINFKTGK